MTLTNEMGQDATKAIETVLSNSSQEQNAQAKLVVYMYNSDVTFSDAVISKLIEAKGGDKTDLFNDHLSQLSERYREMLTQIERITDKKKNERKATELADLDKLDSAVRAVRAMFDRSIRSVYALRKSAVKITDVKIVSRGIKIAFKDENGDDDFDILSGRALTDRGNKMLKDSKPKKESKPEANVSLPTMLKLSFENCARYIMSTDNPIEDMPDEVNDAFDSLVSAILQKKFAHEGTIDKKDVLDYLKTVKSVKLA